MAYADIWHLKLKLETQNEKEDQIACDEESPDSEYDIVCAYLSNFTSEHTAELGLGQGIRLLACLGTKNSRVAAPLWLRHTKSGVIVPRCW